MAFKDLGTCFLTIPKISRNQYLKSIACNSILCYRINYIFISWLPRIIKESSLESRISVAGANSELCINEEWSQNEEQNDFF